MDVPERRCPSYSVAIRFDLIDLPDHNATIDVRAVESGALRSEVILHHISGSGRVDTILVSIFAALYGFLTAHGNTTSVWVFPCATDVVQAWKPKIARRTMTMKSAKPFTSDVS